MEEQIRKIKEGFLGEKMVVLPPDLITYLEKNPLTKDFHITAIGYYPKALYHNRSRKYGSNEYLMLYCVDGEGDVRIQNQTIRLKANNFIILPPKKAHHYRSDNHNPWSIFWVHFKGSNARYLFNKFLNQEEFSPISIPYDTHKIETFIEALSLLLIELNLNSIEYSCTLIKYFISRILYSENVELIKVEDTLINRVREFMKKNIDQPLKISDLSSEVNLSVSRFTELYKEKTGYSPIQNLILFRIQKSCQLLYFTDHSIKEIADEVGFNDPFYFSRMFKKLMGVAPTVYKKQYARGVSSD